MSTDRVRVRYAPSPTGRPARRQHPDGAVCLALRAQYRRRLHRSHRGHRHGAHPGGVSGGHTGVAEVARPGLGRGPRGGRPSLHPTCSRRDWSLPRRCPLAGGGRTRLLLQLLVGAPAGDAQGAAAAEAAHGLRQAVPGRRNLGRTSIRSRWCDSRCRWKARPRSTT